MSRVARSNAHNLSALYTLHTEPLWSFLHHRCSTSSVIAKSFPRQRYVFPIGRLFFTRPLVSQKLTTRSAWGPSKRSSDPAQTKPSARLIPSAQIPTLRRHWSHSTDSKQQRQTKGEETEQTNQSAPATKPSSSQELARLVAHRMQITYTCNVCDLRSTKHFYKKSYQKGIVLIRCDGCKNLHLVADNLGWLGPDKNIEEIMARKGIPIQRYRDSISWQHSHVASSTEPLIMNMPEEDVSVEMDATGVINVTPNTITSTKDTSSSSHHPDTNK